MKFRLALGSFALFGLAVSFGAVALAGDTRPAPAVALLDELDRDPHKDLLADVVKSGRTALERATRMHVAGDEGHAVLAEAVALEWAEAGRDLLTTAVSEEKVAATFAAVIDAGAAVERETAMIEALTLRKGRLEAALAEAQKEAAADAGAAVDSGSKGGTLHHKDARPTPGAPAAHTVKGAK